MTSSSQADCVASRPASKGFAAGIRTEEQQPEAVPTRGEGHEEILALDRNGDGKPDLWAIDTDGDGTAAARVISGAGSWFWVVFGSRFDPEP